jgi:hypothetical protein
MPASRFVTTPMSDGEMLAAFEPTTRPTDVFVSTPPKCGQTWLLALIHHLRTGARDPEFGQIGLLGVTPWLEVPFDVMNGGKPIDRARRLAEVSALPDPRVIKLHVPWDQIPRAEDSGSKVITITRDPRDVPYSMYQHVLAMRPEIRGPSKAEEGFDPWFDLWSETQWAYFRIVRSFWPHRNDPDVLWLRYEDMKVDLPGHAQRCIEFLGWAVDDDTVSHACALADFRTMQGSESTMKYDRAFQRPFVREGGVGKNRARLSPEQEARIIERARRELEPECFDFVLSQGI